MERREGAAPCACSPQVSAVERRDDVGAALDRGGELASRPGLPGRVHQGPWHQVQLLGVVEVPADPHGPVLQVLQLHRAARERGEGAEAGLRSRGRHTLFSWGYKARSPPGLTGDVGDAQAQRGWTAGRGEVPTGGEADPCAVERSRPRYQTSTFPREATHVDCHWDSAFCVCQQPGCTHRSVPPDDSSAGHSCGLGRGVEVRREGRSPISGTGSKHHSGPDVAEPALPSSGFLLWVLSALWGTPLGQQACRRGETRDDRRPHFCLSGTVPGVRRKPGWAPDLEGSPPRAGRRAGARPHSLCGQRDGLGRDPRLQLCDQLQLPLPALHLGTQRGNPSTWQRGEDASLEKLEARPYLPRPQAEGSHWDEKQEPLEEGIIFRFPGRRFCRGTATPARPPGQPWGVHNTGLGSGGPADAAKAVREHGVQREGPPETRSQELACAPVSRPAPDPRAWHGALRGVDCLNEPQGSVLALPPTTTLGN